MLVGLNPDHKNLVNVGKYDEAIALRNVCKFDGPFFFYQAISYYKIKDYRLAKKSAEQAAFYPLEERYVVVLSMMVDEIDNMDEKNKMADISSDMEMVRNRLENGKGGTKTQDIQKKIIAKLDEQIKAAEDEMNKANQQAGASKQNPSEGRKESGIIEEAPPKGEVGNRKLVLSKDNWGNLPAKERTKALESINRQLAPHIKEAAEGFSRKLGNGGK